MCKWGRERVWSEVKPGLMLPTYPQHMRCGVECTRGCQEIMCQNGEDLAERDIFTECMYRIPHVRTRKTACSSTSTGTTSE